MDIQQFQSAVGRSKQFTSRPSNEELLQLYALFKQATEGDVIGEKPVGFDFKAIMKYEAWEALKSMSKGEAMQAYVTLVDKLHQLYA